jgi:hypothetical protein
MVNVPFTFVMTVRVLALDGAMGTVVVVRRCGGGRRGERRQKADGQGQDVSHGFSLSIGFPM